MHRREIAETGLHTGELEVAKRDAKNEPAQRHRPGEAGEELPPENERLDLGENARR